MRMGWKKAAIKISKANWFRHSEGLESEIIND
jgi:hypothetical protein